MKIGIAGVGGIGSNVARILAQSQMESIKIVDFDSVETGNLNRQFYTRAQEGRKKVDCLIENLKQIHPGMDIEAIDQKIGPGDAARIFSDCPIVVEGFDNKSLKKMIVEELAATGKKMVSASGIAGQDLTSVQIRTMGHCHVVGDLSSDQDDHLLYPPKISLVAAIMAGKVLELVIEKEARNQAKG